MNKDAPLPVYKVRRSPRAKRISVTVRPGRGVEVVLPRGVGLDAAKDVVRRKRIWIEKALRRLGMEETGARELPRAIALAAVGMDYQVGYDPCGRGRLRLEANQGRRLAFLGRPGENHEYAALLQSWLADQGRLHLPPWLSRLATESGLSYARAQVRRQLTRWGSCSARGTISLNCKVLFLPPELARYVLLHELAHTVHLNHSSRYWSVVARLEPQWQARERELRASNALVPWWAH